MSLAASDPVRPPKLSYTRRDAFLAAGDVADLLAYAEASENAFRPTSVSGGARPRVDAAIRVSNRVSLDTAMKERLRARFGAVLADIVAELKVEPFELAKMEVELVAHGDGAFYRRHIDTRTQTDDRNLRAISATYYFHREPKAFAGGALRLYEVVPAGEARFVDLEPTHNSCVFFPSWMPHEVLPVACPSRRHMDSRFAINCWYRRPRA